MSITKMRASSRGGTGSAQGAGTDIRPAVEPTATGSTTFLSSRVRLRTHFSRSANLERDHGMPIGDYMPTARAREVLRRVIAGMGDAAAGRAISITGAYGTGKSSLALFLDALLGPPRPALRNPLTRSSARLTQPCTRLPSPRESSCRVGRFCAPPQLRSAEPVTETLLRALKTAVEQRPASQRKSKACTRILEAEPGPHLEILPLLGGLARERAGCTAHH